MLTDSTIHVLSIEGNWNRSVNKKRLEMAAEEFHRTDPVCIIASGTYEPGKINNSNRKKLGFENSQLLARQYSIPASRIFPAYQYPWEFTYTTIEAFSNACTIAWIFSGFRKQAQTIPITFIPVTNNTHVDRVLALNKRACEALDRLNLSVNVQAPVRVRNTPALSDDPTSMEEILKLKSLLSPDGVVTTGKWKHGDEERSFDDLELMKYSFEKLLSNILPGGNNSDLNYLLALESTDMRLATSRVLSQIANSGILTNQHLITLLNRNQSDTAPIEAPDTKALTHLLARYVNREI